MHRHPWQVFPELLVPSPLPRRLRRSRALGFSAAGFFGRLPLSMTGIGVVTRVSQTAGC
ncbi:hypothetical protein AB0G71_09195 [Streptomyces sp. NPDC020403]|uniref:hypothetical protein n=1 Tax=unclassified Streptomyces TaxID=2593676 RepID=UPI0033DFB2E3